MTLADAGARGSGARGSGFGVSLRAATAADAPAIHRLIAENLEDGHLLPRSIADIEQHASRFVVAYEDASACPSTPLKQMLAQGTMSEDWISRVEWCGPSEARRRTSLRPDSALGASRLRQGFGEVPPKLAEEPSGERRRTSRSRRGASRDRRRQGHDGAPNLYAKAEGGQGTVIGCAELAPLSPAVAEVRSLVVDQPFRGRRIGAQLVAHVAAAGAAHGFATLCAFTHKPVHFVRLGFTIVPHVWVPEKIAHDCTGCALFRRCGQYAVTLPLRAGASVRPERSAAVIQGRGVAARRTHIERLHLQPVAYDEEGQDASAEPVSA